MASAPIRQEKPQRILWLDSARGIALITMAIYHFTWDLELFGYIAQGTANTGGWKWFARAIASSFLIIVGISLVLAHANGINLRSYLRRTAIIALAALAITIVTWFATPSGFIFFGILHHIVVASLIGLLCVRLPSWALVALATALIAASHYINLPVFDTRWLAWTGLFEAAPRSNDFVPLVPWFTAVLVGILAGRLILLLHKENVASTGGPFFLQWLGRRSLAVYLIHQPILIGLIYLFSLVSPPAPQAIIFDESMINACETQCLETADETFCVPYCQCAFDLASQSDVLADAELPQTQIELEMSAIALTCERETLENME